MNMSGIQSFIFGKGTDTPTYEDVKSKRALQQRLMASLAQDTPQNIGQGIHAVGKAIGARRAGNQASIGEEAGRSDAEQQFGALQSLWGNSMGGGMTGTASTMGATGTPSFMPADNSTDMGAAAGNGPGLGYGLPDSIVRTESGGNWNALNSEGYGGRGQFGEARLADAARAGVIPDGMTGADFSRAPEQTQLAVENWHKQDIMGDLGRYVGQDIDGPGGIPPLTEDSILAVAHLGGTGGARKFIESGGKYNPSDSNGTSLSDYATTHAGGGMNATVSTQGAPGQSFGGAQPDMAALSQVAQFMDNPYASDGQKALAGLMMQRMLQPGPSQMDQIELQRAQLELQQMQNPQPDQTAGMQEYEYARNQGFEGSLLDYQTARAQAGRSQTTVNNNMGEEAGQYLYGTDGGVPAGWRVDRNTGEASPIPGGPVTVEDQAIQDKDALTQAGVERSTNIVQEDIGRALGIIEQSPRWTTGLGARLAAIPGTDAKSLSGLLETIKANVGFDRLQQMRDASPTGGALGAINESEMRLLQSVIGNLDQSLDAEDLAYNLNRVNDVYLQIVNGTGGQPQPTPDAVQTQAAPPPPPQGTQLSPDEWSRAWSAMTPEERALFQ
jgi:hypothetical protein